MNGTKLCGFFLILVLFYGFGCSYPNIQTVKLEELTVDNKRLEGKSRHIREFIRPEETKDILEKLQLQNFHTDEEINFVLNALLFVQQLKRKNDKKDYWQYPKETINNGGDCEDKTFLLLSLLIQAGVKEVKGVKGRSFGSGHMWVEFNEFILDPWQNNSKLIHKKKSLGYNPFFKFDHKNIYYCRKEK